MIKSFGDGLTEKIFIGVQDKEVSRFPQELLPIARRKLDMIHYATCLQDLIVPMSNRLEKLRGDLDGFYSIRINIQWRVVFIWRNRCAYSVQIIDYH